MMSCGPYVINFSGGVYVLFDGRINQKVEGSSVCSKTLKPSDLFS